MSWNKCSWKTLKQERENNDVFLAIELEITEYHILIHVCKSEVENEFQKSLPLVWIVPYNECVFSWWLAVVQQPNMHKLRLESKQEITTTR